MFFILFLSLTITSNQIVKRFLLNVYESNRELKGYSARSKFPSNAHARRRNFIDKAFLKMDGRRKAAMNSPSADRHKSLHFKSSPSPLAWKDAYRQKCIQRLRTGREKLVDRFRNINVQLNQDDDDGDESMDMQM